MKRFRAEIALAGVTVLWGTTFVVVKAALGDVSAFAFLAMRFWLAALALCVIYWRALRNSGGRLRSGVIAGCFLFAGFSFQTLGLARTTPSKSAFLTGLSIPLVPFVSSIVYKVLPRGIDLLGVAVASAGMALMTLPPGSGWRWEMSSGDLLTVFCAIAFAIHIVVVGHYSQLEGFQSLAVIQIASAAALASFFLWFAEPVRMHFTPAVALAVLITGLLATALAFTTQAWAQQYTSATRAAFIYTLEPPVAWLTSYLLTGEKISNRGKVGAGMILVGILAVELTRVTNPPVQASQ